MDRRRFLETSSRAAVGVVVAAAGGSTLLMASDGAWAMSLEALSAADATTLLKALRVIYPHDSLGDQYYAVVVAALDQDAKANGEAAALLKDGIAGLDQAQGIPFAELSEGNQLRTLEAIEDSAVLPGDPRQGGRRPLQQPAASGRRSATRAPRSTRAATSSAASTTSAGCPIRRPRPARRSSCRGRRKPWLPMI